MSVNSRMSVKSWMSVKSRMFVDSRMSVRSRMSAESREKLKIETISISTVAAVSGGRIFDAVAPRLKL